MKSTQMVRVLFACVVANSQAFQQQRRDRQYAVHRGGDDPEEDDDGVEKAKLQMLDEGEVEQRGSHCLDGSTPGYYFKEGTEDGKMFFWFNGGVYCISEEHCARLPSSTWPDEFIDMPLHRHSTFAGYHYVALKNCDLGLYMGDRDDTVTKNGKKMYFQGSRIVKHVVDTVSKNYTFKEVLMAGGSCGGQSIFSMADYFKGLMPSSVTKFAIAPINGWFHDGSLDTTYDLHGMKNIISENCRNAFNATEQYNCIDPAQAWKYSTLDTFVTQILDQDVVDYSGNSSLQGGFNRCLSNPGEMCKSDDVSVLQEYWDNFTTSLDSYPQKKAQGNAGFISTCTVHTFYKDPDLFVSYKNRGVTVGDAISKWWDQYDSSNDWYLPCTLAQPPAAQCEPSCGKDA